MVLGEGPDEDLSVEEAGEGEEPEDPEDSAAEAEDEDGSEEHQAQDDEPSEAVAESKAKSNNKKNKKVEGGQPLHEYPVYVAHMLCPTSRSCTWHGVRFLRMQYTAVHI